MPKDTKSNSQPLAPEMSGETAPSGIYPGAVGTTAPSENTTAVQKGHSKNPAADPSRGTATARTADLERNGAQYRVRHQFPAGGPANEPYSGATMSNTPVVPSGQTPTDDKNYAAGTNQHVTQTFVSHRDGQRAAGVR